MTMWIQTYTGKAVDFDKPITPDVICLEDIAHALAMQCRFNGHCLRFYSIAEHSVYVAERVDELWEIENGVEAPPIVRKWALLHDAAEAYVGDMVRPLKHSPNLTTFRDYERTVLSAIEIKFVSATPPKAVRDMITRADLELLATERDKIMAAPPQPWDPLPDPLDVCIHCLLPESAEAMFIGVAQERGLQ